MLPEHVAFIMDGNGRWAKSRGQNRLFGHKKGAEVVDEITSYARKIGIKTVTLYAFSTQNWERPKDEVNGLMQLLAQYIKNKTEKIMKNNIRFSIIGNRSQLPSALLRQIEELERKSENNDGMNMCLALSYGSREEIVNAVKNIVKSCKNNETDPSQITEKTISENLWTKDMKDPDLIIRTSGEQRLSNFLMWQAAYSELFFTNTPWPDFTAREFQNILNEYETRERRFGKTSEQLKG